MREKTDGTKRMMRGRSLRIAAAVLAISLLGGCSPVSEEDDSLAKVMEAGELVMGLDECFPPMGFRDDDGNITGFDVDLAAEVCDRMGIKLVTKPINWEYKEDELKTGSIDCIWNGLSVSEERSEKMNLSRPYMNNELVFIVTENSPIRSISDLRDKTIGTQSGSSTEAVLYSSAISGTFSTVYAEDNVELMKRLDEGKIDAVFIDSIFAYYYISNSGKNYYVLPGVLGTEQFAIGFRKGEDKLRDRIQEILSQMKADGTLGEISTEWFGTDVTTVR